MQTSDAAVRDGTAYLTDCGMTGPHDSVIGVRTESSCAASSRSCRQRFEPAEGDVRIEGALLECDATTGRAHRCEGFRREA